MFCASCGGATDATGSCPKCAAVPASQPSASWARPPNASVVTAPEWKLDGSAAPTPWPTPTPPPAKPPAPVESRLPQLVSVILVVLLLVAVVFKLALAYLFVKSHTLGPAPGVSAHHVPSRSVVAPFA